MTKRKEITAWNRTIRQWAWYEKHPLAKKEEYFEKHSEVGKPRNTLCFLCEVYPDHCLECPLFNQGQGCYNNNLSDPYSLWEKAILDGNKTSYSEQARIIKEAVMKWKEDHK